jgi:hypothetical protein
MFKSLTSPLLLLPTAEEFLSDDVCGALLTLLSASGHANTFLTQLIAKELDLEHMVNGGLRRT